MPDVMREWRTARCRCGVRFGPFESGAAARVAELAGRRCRACRRSPLGELPPLLEYPRPPRPPIGEQRALLAVAAARDDFQVLLCGVCGEPAARAPLNVEATAALCGSCRGPRLRHG